MTGLRVLAPRTFNLRVHSAVAELEAWFGDEHASITGVELQLPELLRQLALIQAGQEPAAGTSS